jgi:hypothetical protein
LSALCPPLYPAKPEHCNCFVTVDSPRWAITAALLALLALLKRHELPAFKVGADWRFSRADVDRWRLAAAEVLRRKSLVGFAARQFWRLLIASAGSFLEERSPSDDPPRVLS